ncbi:DUF4411 family protein [Dyadobacter sp. Leaf189]|uniref:DUF4411 family protein n=1 Tax=Dyadobacter sp. Leaf189 TaxID=1736295 RepID=UPI0006F8A864|nr:DUF4411 family protein [Dyadobacter sp. Leaf189]KQS26657.1 hypothetical protein ASG33_18985 [Dyadobacter sp. Leaf189]
MKYVIDTSSFTQAHRAYYSFKIAPTFWNFLDEQFKCKTITSIDKVYDEIKRGKDKLYEWICLDGIKSNLIDTKKEPGILQHYGNLMQWANGIERLKQNARDEFATFENADPWIVCCAMHYELIVVSQETLSPFSKSRIFIPDVCEAFSIRHINTFEFLEDIGFKM